MQNDKKLPQKTRDYLTTLDSGATISLPPGTLGIPLRGYPNKNRQIAEIVGGNRDEFSREYIAPNKQGEDILKSDKAKLTSPYTYQEVPKSENPHHHITEAKSMEDRVNSIINSTKN